MRSSAAAQSANFGLALRDIIVADIALAQAVTLGCTFRDLDAQLFDPYDG